MSCKSSILQQLSSGLSKAFRTIFVAHLCLVCHRLGFGAKIEAEIREKRKAKKQRSRLQSDPLACLSGVFRERGPPGGRQCVRLRHLQQKGGCAEAGVRQDAAARSDRAPQAI